MSRVMRPLQLELLGADGGTPPPAVHAVLRDVARLAAALDQQNRPTAPIRVRERQAVQLIRLLLRAHSSVTDGYGLGMCDRRLRWGAHPIRVVTTHDTTV
jgi:hypothetical protein